MEKKYGVSVRDTETNSIVDIVKGVSLVDACGLALALFRSVNNPKCVVFVYSENTGNVACTLVNE